MFGCFLTVSLQRRLNEPCVTAADPLSFTHVILLHPSSSEMQRRQTQRKGPETQRTAEGGHTKGKRWNQDPGFQMKGSQKPAQLEHIIQLVDGLRVIRNQVISASLTLGRTRVLKSRAAAESVR